jgi:hypothetical protein
MVRHPGSAPDGSRQTASRSISGDRLAVRPAAGQEPLDLRQVAPLDQAVGGALAGGHAVGEALEDAGAGGVGVLLDAEVGGDGQQRRDEIPVGVPGDLDMRAVDG